MQIKQCGNDSERNKRLDFENGISNVFKDTGIALGPAFTRKGYGRQILMELVHQAFDE